jgi:hypothetical protein
MPYYQEGQELSLPRVEQVLKLLKQTYERHLCTNTFTGIISWVLTLELRVLKPQRLYSG